MRRDLLNIAMRFASLTGRIEKAQDQATALAQQRAAFVASLLDTMTQRELADLLGISQQRISQLIKIAGRAEDTHPSTDGGQR